MSVCCGTGALSFGAVALDTTAFRRVEERGFHCEMDT